MTHRSSSFRSRHLTLEGLESRTVMDGNVTAAVTDGILRIQGDELGNDVQIRPIAQTFTGEWPGAKYEITGRSRHNGAPTTTINGQASVIAEGVKNGASIGLGHGNNFLQVSNPGGSPTQHRPAAISGPVTINTGSDMDLIRLYIQNRAQVTINTGGDDDRIEISRSTLNKLTISADWSGAGALPRAGDDQIKIGASVVNGAAKIYMGPNHLHAFEDLTIQYGAKFNGGFSFDGAGSHLRWWTKSTGSQVNGPVDVIALWVSFENVDIDGSLRITGNNQVSGGGLNDVTITGDLSFFGLGGDDSFGLKDVKATKTLLDGGADTDTYRDFGGNDLGELTLVSIENTEIV